jgi:hypothetical protein
MGLLRSRKELRAPFHVLELHLSPAVRPLEYRRGREILRRRLATASARKGLNALRHYFVR